MQAGIECLFVIGTAPLQHRMGVDSSWPGPLWTGGVSAGMKLFLDFKSFFWLLFNSMLLCQPFAPKHPHSPYSSLYCFFGTDKENLFINLYSIYHFTFLLPVVKDLLRHQKNFCSVWQAFDILHKMIFIFIIIIIIIIIIDNQPDSCCRLRKFSSKWDN